MDPYPFCFFFSLSQLLGRQRLATPVRMRDWDADIKILLFFLLDSISLVHRILKGHSGASPILYRENWRVCTLCAHGKNEHRHARSLHRLLSLATPLYILPYIPGGLLRRSLSRLDSSGAFPSPLLLPWPPFHPSYKTDSLAGSQQYFSNSLISTGINTNI